MYFITFIPKNKIRKGCSICGYSICKYTYYLSRAHTSHTVQSGSSLWQGVSLWYDPPREANDMSDDIMNAANRTERGGALPSQIGIIFYFPIILAWTLQIGDEDKNRRK